MRIPIVFLLLLTLSVSYAIAQKSVTFKKNLYLNKGDTLPYNVIEPLTIAPGQKYPLVIFLHGAGERGNENESNVKHLQLLYNRNVLDKYPSFVLAPQCPRKEVWSTLMYGKPFSATPTRPMQLFLQLLDHFIKENPVDVSRIYITGVSMGGYATWDLLARFPTRFAAAVPVCGGGDVNTVSKFKHVPIWAFHGAEDEVVPPAHSRKMIDALRREGSLPGYTEYPAIKHSSWHQAYKEPMLMAWLFRQSLNNIGKTRTAK